MTMSAALSTSTKGDRPHAEPTDDGETGGHAVQGMVEGLKTQEQDRAIHELSFLERLSLLVDQQWSWRENQALERRLKAAKLRGPACVEDIDYRAARGLDKTVVRALAKDSAWVRNHENIFVIGSDRRGQELYRLSAGTESLSRRLLGSLSCGLPLCFVSWPWPEPTGVCDSSWHDSVASMSWSSMTGP